MNVSFYGHVRQYHSIKSEIDSNIQQVLESGNYVMGPVLKRFEQEFAAYHGLPHAIGVAKIKEADAAVGVRFLSLDCSAQGDARVRNAVPGYYLITLKAGSSTGIVGDTCWNVAKNKPADVRAQTLTSEASAVPERTVRRPLIFFPPS